MNTILELFAGVGGFRYAADALGLHTVAAYDFDSNACAAYERLHGSGVIQQADLDAIDPCSLPDASGIVGGPPCQPFSKAGRLRGAEDDRDAWPATVSIVAHKQPDWFCFENVPALTWNIDYFRGLLYAFMELGYCVSWRVLNAADYGVPQTRQRVFILGRRIRGGAVCLASANTPSGRHTQRFCCAALGFVVRGAAGLVARCRTGQVTELDHE